MTHYCPAFWAIYDDACAAVDAGTLDEYGMEYLFKDHWLLCDECKPAKDYMQLMKMKGNDDDRQTS